MFRVVLVAGVVASVGAVYCKTNCPVVGENSFALGGGEGSGTYTYVSHGGVPVISVAAVDFTKNDLNTGSEPSASVEKYARSLGDPGDDAGHIYANRLGGKAVPINIFPQSPHINRGIYEKFERQIFECFDTQGASKGSLKWTFTYDQDSDTRPSGVSYSASFDAGCSDLQQTFDNPHTSLEYTMLA
mmetsp:Transcript_29782/g.85364  ORF Transcript_29782/g.85364 Transcript_29782/m.85364 type:complete len:187 (-) Transcript_29782:167-727(-)|eukprot:CAMPEP_0177354024 /NCGR_PEP_ID=MMETSP0368-20130122/33198_1 /TAXON_ID=447022 ORGANISM="Scrippsiella hangoei-like, Strain SHHI-4" /NCGR_SAMPLE_ID=MMETSP0368 /ASSEMBLY_ACC=CAM_ASM_000363 /LENGTH=186 /DNA_ID=CAMNT_0018816115 /DNA_START=64 /DNA_END=624 /DNA_ORIENTATION=-